MGYYGIEPGVCICFTGQIDNKMLELAKEHDLVSVDDWKTKKQQEEFHYSKRLFAISKRQIVDCEKFRASTTMKAAYKAQSQFVFRHLSPITNKLVGSYQVVFIDGRSTTD